VTDRRRDDTEDFLDEEGPGSDPGVGYERAAESGQVEEPEDEGTPSPDVGDVHRSGS
jgi:hypothetical protein